MSNKKYVKEMDCEILKDFLMRENIIWHGSVLDKNGNLFKPQTVGEIKKGSKLDLTSCQLGIRTMYDFEVNSNKCVISLPEKDFSLILTPGWKLFLDECVKVESKELEL